MSGRRTIDERTAALAALRLRDEPGLSLRIVAAEAGLPYEALRRAVRKRQRTFAEMAVLAGERPVALAASRVAIRVADRPRVPRACLPLLLAEAGKRGAEPMALAGRILCAVLTGQLVDAVLDDAA